MIENILKKRKAVREYNTSVDISEELIDKLLYQTWAVTPSKNQFMPYTVNILGPAHQDYKNLIYLNCLSNENKTDNIEDCESERYQKFLPQYANIKSCSYLLVFTMRLEDSPNKMQQLAIDKGRRHEATDETRLNKLYSTASLEVGMFANTLSALCLENEIDVSYVLCFHKDLAQWSNIPFVKRQPILLMTIGKGDIYRVDHLKQYGWLEYDLKPDYKKIVNFI